MPSQSETFTKDPFGARHPTSHEQRTGRPWDASYQNGPAPWDIGHPQAAILRLASTRKFTGPVLDAGCGTGENALLLASLGLTVLGIDVADTALGLARNKASERGMHADFIAADALQLERLGRKFRTVLDCGLFHTFNGNERQGYVASLSRVTEHSGTLYVLCFSDSAPDTGPHPVSEAELRAAFTPASGWIIADLAPERIQTRFHVDGAPAWLATATRI
ncbi:MAG: class I SAM-dependent methyltransferase [Acidobacteriaceae bacterium]